MERIDLTSKQSKMSSYVVKHSKLRKTQNYKSHQIRINLHRFDVKTIKNVEYVANHSKQRKTTKVIKLQWIASIWCQKHQTNAKLQKRSYFDEFASIWRQNEQKCWVTSQNIQNNAKLRKWSNYNVLHQFAVKTI